MYVLYTSTPDDVAVLEAADAVEEPVEDEELDAELASVVDKVEVDNVDGLPTEDKVELTELVLAAAGAKDPPQVATQ